MCFAFYVREYKMKVLLGFVLLASTFFGTATAAKRIEDLKKKGTLVVGSEAGFLPFEMRSPAGKWIGFDVDIMEAFGKSLGVKVEFADTKFDGIIPALMAKKFDVIASGMTITPERAKVVLFSKPYYKAGLTALVAVGNTKLVSFESLNNPTTTLALKVGTTGDIYSSKNLTKAQVKKFDSESDAAMAVLLGKVDSFVYDKPFLELFAGRHKTKLKTLPGLLSEEEFGYGLRRSDTELANALNTFLDESRKNGFYDSLIRKHFVDMPWAKEFPDFK
jgi:polar amino acid transport system substrate-binding protein